MRSMQLSTLSFLFLFLWASTSWGDCKSLLSPDRVEIQSGRSIVGIDNRLTAFVSKECLSRSSNTRNLKLITKANLAKKAEEKPFSLIDIVKLGFYTDVSPYLMGYEATHTTEKYPRGIIYGSLVALEEKGRFSALAKAKGIRPPQPPFILDEVSLNGSSPKAKLLDQLGQKWVVKWGDEIHSDVAGSHIFAELGFDVDHPYFLSGTNAKIKLPEDLSVQQLVQSLYDRFKVNLSPMIHSSGPGWVQFHKVAVEARPESVVRLGGLPFEDSSLMAEKVLSGVMLAHQFIGNWDVKSDNTMLSLVQVDGQSQLSGAFNDLGASFGVRINKVPRDMKFGLPNEYSTPFIDGDAKRFSFVDPVNELNETLLQRDPKAMRYMAERIVSLSPEFLKKVVKVAGWPEPIADYYFYQLRQRQVEIEQKILNRSNALALVKPDVKWPMVFKGEQLAVDFERKLNPESFLSSKGRFRNYGW